MSYSGRSTADNDELKRQVIPTVRPHGPTPRGARRGTADIAEHQPVMRSATIVPPRTKILQHEDSLMKDRSVFVRPQVDLNHLRSTRQDSLFDHGSVLKREDVVISEKDKNWVVADNELEPPPADFPLERTSRVISGTKAGVVAERISKCLQTRSIKAKYSKTESLATCRNLDFVKFLVRLFSDDGGVLVEVQRLCGDGVSFMRDYRAIIAACDGEPVDNLKPEVPLYLRLPISEMPGFNSLEPLHVSGAGLESVQMAADLLSKEMMDVNMLGMESLASLSDPLKTFRPTSLLCAKRILCSEEEGNDYFNIHKCLMRVIVYGYESDCDLKLHLDQTALSDYGDKLRNLALCSTSNAVRLLHEDRCLNQIISSNQDWFLEVLVPRLVEDIVTAQDHPHDACYASRCLSCLASTSPIFAEKIKEEGGLWALKSAEQVGKNEFALLASEADSCRNAILRCF